MDKLEAVKAFPFILNSLPESPNSKKCWSRLKSRQESLVFLMVIRFMISSLPVSELKELIEVAKSADSYPLRNSVVEDYNGLIYNIFTKVINCRYPDF
ncbi:hypothetical protein [Lentiprolixibacter aurantiacus]|uniref:Uncharacterized protein n=1 Tax=Lentiprolixibacter aurantiacus TaxID=2993939 RepID=A0AAE3SNT1_9FLAO|nr:hypothetical protein [Lentiprolixibacter aurantiacus]MCX2719865.1 hypothetical protein [Lentiprolixibacter aurantiacus]